MRILGLAFRKGARRPLYANARRTTLTVAAAVINGIDPKNAPPDRAVGRAWEIFQRVCDLDLRYAECEEPNTALVDAFDQAEQDAERDRLYATKRLSVLLMRQPSTEAANALLAPLRLSNPSEHGATPRIEILDPSGKAHVVMLSDGAGFFNPIDSLTRKEHTALLDLVADIVRPIVDTDDDPCRRREPVDVQRSLALTEAHLRRGR